MSARSRRERGPGMKRVYHAELTVAEGIEVLKGGHAAAGFDLPGGRKLFLNEVAMGRRLCCAFCGLAADRFVLETDTRQHVRGAVLNLYAATPAGGLALMTRDHIIPKARGGSDAPANLRVACEPCNGRRGHKMTAEDLAFERAHPELIDQERLARARRARIQQEHDERAGEARRAERRASVENEARFQAEKAAAKQRLIDADPALLSRSDQAKRRRLIEAALPTLVFPMSPPATEVPA